MNGGAQGERHAAYAPLVAWYVNGTLEPGERAVVEAHLAECADCRAQVELWREVAPVLATAGAPPAPHPSQFQHLVARLDEQLDEPAPETPSAARPARQLPWRWRWVVAAQAAALALVGIAFFVRPAAEAPRAAPFRTLATAAMKVEGLRLRVVFDERASEAELRALLVPLGATIVGGPTPLGVYTVALPEGVSPAEAAAALRARPIVRFAEPVAP
jgi:anti-sigma-K factor RskA